MTWHHKSHQDLLLSSQSYTRAYKRQKRRPTLLTATEALGKEKLESNFGRYKWTDSHQVCRGVTKTQIVTQISSLYLLFKYPGWRNPLARTIYFLVLNSSGSENLKQTETPFTVRKLPHIEWSHFVSLHVTGPSVRPSRSYFWSQAIKQCETETC